MSIITQNFSCRNENVYVTSIEEWYNLGSCLGNKPSGKMHNIAEWAHRCTICFYCCFVVYRIKTKCLTTNCLVCFPTIIAVTVWIFSQIIKEKQSSSASGLSACSTLIVILLLFHPTLMTQLSLDVQKGR